jgi:hypothetical protein
MDKVSEGPSLTLGENTRNKRNKNPIIKKRRMKRSNQLCQTCGHSKKSGETAKLHNFAGRMPSSTRTVYGSTVRVVEGRMQTIGQPAQHGT